MEGPSDPHYLSAIKNYLIGSGAIRPSKELVFIPSGGVRGVRAVAAIVTAKDEELPNVVLDSDGPGKDLAKSLKSGLYEGQAGRIIEVGQINSMEGSEIEDLFPQDFLSRILSRYMPRPSDIDIDFEDLVKPGTPIIPQVEQYAADNGIKLELGWKVEVAKRAKAALLTGRYDIDEKTKGLWSKLFLTFGVSTTLEIEETT